MATPKFFAAFVLAGLALGATANAETIAITNAKILSQGPAGDIAKGTIVFTNGWITAIGANVTPPSDARVIDAKGKAITPGIILPGTDVSIVEIGGVSSGRDDHGGERIGAAFDVSLGVNPRSVHLPIARRAGITRAIIMPAEGSGRDGMNDEDGNDDYTAGGREESLSGLFTGRPAAIWLRSGETEIVTHPRLGVIAEFGDAGASAAGGSRAAALTFLKAALEDARYFAANRAAYDKGQTRPLALARHELDALLPVAEGRAPLIVRVHRAGDITAILKFAGDQKLKLILVDAEEGWLVARDIAKANVPVVIDPLANLPASFETQGSTLFNAQRLNDAGVKLAIQGLRGVGRMREPRLNAGTAVAYGLPPAAALAAITINPAKIFGIAERTGSLEVGKSADVVIWTGDPLEISSYAEQVFIGGKLQSTEGRQQRLAERYRDPGAPTPSAYR